MGRSEEFGEGRFFKKITAQVNPETIEDGNLEHLPGGRNSPNQHNRAALTETLGGPPYFRDHLAGKGDIPL